MDETQIAPLDNLSVRGLDPARPPAEQIQAHLKEAILSMALAPGVLVSETEVGHRFGASRTPVREAFAQLREEGLIVTRPSRGNYVSRLSVHGIKQAQFLREALELGTVARLCEMDLDGVTQQAVDKTLAAQADAVRDNDNAAFQRQDDAFHALLARATGYARAESVLLREKASLDRLRVLSLSTPQTKARLLTEHTEIWTAIRGGQTARATDAMRQHLRSILATLTHVVTQNGEFFE